MSRNRLIRRNRLLHNHLRAIQVDVRSVDAATLVARIDALIVKL
jgi:hypothetical protein